MPDEPAENTRPTPSPEDSGSIPVARPAAAAGSPPEQSAQAGGGSLYELETTKCPRCGSVLGAQDVVCVKCGYDLQANVVREPEISTAYTEPEAPESAPLSKPEFVLPGRGDAKTAAIAGLLLLVGAMIAAGFRAAQIGASGYVALMIALTLYQALVQTATGVVAVCIAAYLLSYRMSRFEVVAGRMLAVTAVFLLVANLPVTAKMEAGFVKTLAGAAVFLLAGGAYWVTFMFLFRKGRQPAALVMIVHAALWLLLNLGLWLSALAAAERAIVR